MTTTPVSDAANAFQAHLAAASTEIPAHLPGTEGYESGRFAWNAAADQRPAVVALPRSADEVSAVVRAAAAAGLRVRVQSTGHAASALSRADLSDVVLVNLRDFSGVTIDEETRVARILGGTLWQDVVAAAAPHGLTALHGSAGDVAAIGYLLNGGLSFYARRHGLAINSVRAVEIVLADGSIVRASGTQNTSLFWAARGGAGAIGVVTAVEIDLLPYPDVIAGMLLWDAARAAEVVRAYRDWTLTAPASATTSLRIMHFPPLPELPPFLSGRSVVVIDGAILDDDQGGALELEPLRALTPEMDTFGRMPSAGLLGVHMDPPVPTPSVSDHAIIETLPDAGVEAFLAASGVESGLMFAELRQLGGAVGRSPEHGGALAAVPGSFALYAIAVAPFPEAVEAGRAATARVVEALAPYAADRLLPTFAERADGREAKYGEHSSRLSEEARRFDPHGTFISVHQIRA